jgi:uncharacterized protein involved in response to NO
MFVMAIPLALARRRDYSGPAIFSYGFRPFFFAAAVWAALGIVLWLPQFFGEIALPIAMGPLDWHVHEMLYGYVAAVIAGFLLTAVPNWTGRLPICGLPLAMLAALWLAGRIAILVSAKVSLAVAAAIDVAFLATMAAVVLREIVAGRNWRNLLVLAILLVLVAGNVLWHAEMLSSGVGHYGPRIALAATITLIMTVGGRIVPSFTHNWIARCNPGRLPVPFARYDGASIAVAALALAMWVFLPSHPASGVLLVIAGVLHAARLARWAGDRALADRLILVLHVAYAFIPLGFLLLGSAILWPAMVPASAGLHAWTTGAIGLMTLAVMTRAALGHTGRPLVASGPTQAVYAFAIVAALTRIIAAFTGSSELLHLAAFAWLAAFGGYAASYAPLLLRRPPVWAGRGS